MCPLYPFHFIFLYLLVIFSLFYVIVATVDNVKFWNITFSPSSILNLKISESARVNFSLPQADNHDLSSDYEIRVVNKNSDITKCDPMFLKIPTSADYNQSLYFYVTGNFVGISSIHLELANKKSPLDPVKVSAPLKVTVIKKVRLIDKIFTVSVAVLVSVLFINFGCALNWDVVKDNFRKPSNLLIGIACQFIIMPIMSFCLGQLIFPESISMRLGLFFTGVSPSGGASNIWIYALGGNINLSIAITAVVNLLSFFTIPLWTFSLGRLIFNSGKMIVPYQKIAIFAVCLMFPLLLGMLLQKSFPKFSQLMVRILKPFSTFLIVFIIVFATYTNIYLFKLFTSDILIAGFCLPFFGYVIAWFIAYFMQRSFDNCLAISVETGVQNTGIAIYMLQFSLPQPEADLTTVIPVAVALMTPIPLMLWYFTSKIFFSKKKKQNLCLEFPVDDKVNLRNSSLINQLSSDLN